MAWNNTSKNSSSFSNVSKDSSSWSNTSKKSVRPKFFSPDFDPFKDDAPFKENSVVVGTSWTKQSKS